jgi:hypothetical protein
MGSSFFKYSRDEREFGLDDSLNNTQVIPLLSGAFLRYLDPNLEKSAKFAPVFEKYCEIACFSYENP